MGTVFAKFSMQRLDETLDATLSSRSAPPGAVRPLMTASPFSHVSSKGQVCTYSRVRAAYARVSRYRGVSFGFGRTRHPREGAVFQWRHFNDRARAALPRSSSFFPAHLLTSRPLDSQHAVFGAADLTVAAGPLRRCFDEQTEL